MTTGFLYPLKNDPGELFPRLKSFEAEHEVFERWKALNIISWAHCWEEVEFYTIERKSFIFLQGK